MPADTIQGTLPTFVAEERERVADITADLVAIHVYQELQVKNDLVRVAGCNIVGNCSSSSKSALVGR